MKSYLFIYFLFTSVILYAQDTASYRVKRGNLHSRGSISIKILPSVEQYKVEIRYDVKKKDFVPVPSRLLKGKTILEFPQEFRTEEGYQQLERRKRMDTPKAVLKFVKRGDYRNLKDAYFFEIHPKNKKSKIDVIYHPGLPAVGWQEVEITFLSNIPLLNGYELEATLR